MLILPVIHHLDRTTSLEQAEIAFDAGADGVFLISHFGKDGVLSEIAATLKARFPLKRVGLNLLRTDIVTAAQTVARAGLDMVWGDACGVSSAGLTPEGQRLQRFAETHPTVEVFSSVAFKYQAEESDPALAAATALAAGFIPTTSGPATGVAAPLEKVVSMSRAANGTLALASGLSVDNVARYAPHLSHCLVATGVSLDDHHFDYELLYRFVALARQG